MEHSNPFSDISKDKYEENISLIVTSIIKRTADYNSFDPWWMEMEKYFLNSLFLATYICFSQENMNIQTIIKLLGDYDISDENDRVSNPSYLDIFFRKLSQDELVIQMYGNTNPALRNWEYFRTNCKGRTAQSVKATALARLVALYK